MDDAGTMPVLLAETSLLRSLTLSFVIIGLSVCMHGLVMRVLYNKLCFPGRLVWVRLTAVVLTLLVCHVAQILLFGAGYHFLVEQTNSLSGVYDGSFNDAVYFSAAVYTTVGFGDITPLGYLRLMVSFEALAGLVLIAWSASFTFFAMTRMSKPAGGDSEELEHSVTGQP
ncbi:MAG: potassium channel family protein [Planctomycetota bacterium]